MNPKIRYKTGLLLMLFMLTFTFTRCQESEAEHRYSTENTISFEVQAEKDFEELRKKFLKLCPTHEDCEKFHKGTFWYAKAFEEDYHKRNISLALAFLKKYPKGKYHFKTLKLYLSYLAEPKFLDSLLLTKDKREILKGRRPLVNGKIDMNLHYHKFRSLPYNLSARERWLRQGDSLVQNFLASNAPQDQKAEIEVDKMARDKRIARYHYEFLHLDKQKEETEFWVLFDHFYWKGIIQRMDDLIFKYPDYPKWPRDVDLFIKGLTLSFLSPERKKEFWEHYRDLTDKPELFKQHPVLAKVHEKAKKNLQAIEALKTFDEGQPLQMQLTSINGENIDLKDYRGKVVLLDFWSIRCGPCIKEMPHIQTLYDKYKEQGFEVIGISAESDTEEERVLEITKKQGANWPQVLDRGADAIISYQSLFKINHWPTTWLLNKEGVIVDKNARGDRLEPLIQKYLH